MSNKEKFYDELKRSKSYRTQAVFNCNFLEIPGENVYMEDKEKWNIKLLWMYNNYLYNHQKKCLDEIKNGKNVILSNYFNTGRSTIAIICSLKKIFEECKTVLYIAKNEYDKKIQIENIKKILNNINYDWIVDIEDLTEKKLQEINYIPLFYITDIKELHSKIIPNYKKYPTFWNSIGLIVLENLETFSGNIASNLYYVIRRLNQVIKLNNGNPQYFITTKPIQNLESYAARLIGQSKSVIISGDYKEKNAYYLFQWVPAISKINISIYEDYNHMQLERADYYEEVIRIALEALIRGKNVLIYHSGIHISSGEIKKYNDRIAEIAAEKKIGKWFISDDLEQLSLDLYKEKLKFDDVDVVIVVGLEGPFSSALQDLRHIGKNNTEKYFIMPKFPQYQFFIQHPEEFIESPHISDDLRREEAKAIFNMNENDEELTKKNYLIMAKEGLIQTNASFTINEKTIECLKNNELINDDFSLTEKGNKYIDKWNSLNGEDLNISNIENFFKIYDENDILLMLCDPIEAINYFYPYAAVKLMGDRYQVIEFSDKDKIIKVRKIENFWVSYPAYSVQIINEKKIKEIKYKESLDIVIGEATLKLELKKSKVSIFLKMSDLQTYEVGNCSLEEKVNFIKIGPFDSDKLAHTIAHLIFTAICTRFLIKGKEKPKFFIKDKFIYFYSSFYFGLDFFYLLCDTTIINDLLERSYRMIADCPCPSGCFGCLYIFECSEDNCNNLDKLVALNFLGSILKKNDYPSLIHWKKDGLNTDDTIKLDSIKKESLEILKNKGIMRIDNPYKIRFLTEQDKDEYGFYAGICDQFKNQVMVSAGYPEQETYEIVSHEYAHNWQFKGNLNPIFYYFNPENIDDDNNILFAGKIFVEGHATFCSIKVLDYFGIDSKAKFLPGYYINQYKYGANLILFLESQIGYLELLNILKNGNVDRKIIKKWYTDSQIAAGIQADINNIIESGGLKCLKCLNRDANDLNRCSYHLQATSIMIQKKETLADLIKNNEIAEIIWKHLKNAIKAAGGCNGTKCDECQLPCITCNRAHLETLEEACVLFKSITYAEKIREEIKKISKDKDTD